MGYRSDVAIAIHKDLQGEFLTFLKTEQLMAQIFGNMSDFYLDKDYQGEGHWLFTADSIKWYASFAEYTDIQMFEKFMDDSSLSFVPHAYPHHGNKICLVFVALLHDPGWIRSERNRYV